MQDNNQNKNQNNSPKRHFFDWRFLIVIVLLIAGIVFFVRLLTQTSTTTISYSEFEYYIQKGNNYQVTEVTATPSKEYSNLVVVEGNYQVTKDGKTTQYSFKVIMTYDQLSEIVAKIQDSADTTYEDVKVTYTNPETSMWLSLLVTFLPTILILVISFILFRSLLRSQGGAGGAMDFGKSTAVLNRGKTCKFEDVAGCDEEKDELVEIIDFLKNPRKYNEIGARVPKGVILFGPPGTGKTLLAKAVAGEAGVPFFSISGSDFVEMFVGVGASRVRDMFKTAKQNAPCIIFIDEIDAVGRQRGAGMGGGHDEREQTLNQLLVEMDGFNGTTGIIVMAATNRPDVLDPALLRPGRFDRQITISNPDVRGREAILKVHARNKHIDPSVKLDGVAARTPGFSGADLENLLNEAALLAARENRKVINHQDIDEATDRVMMGPAKKSRQYTEHERKLVAYHEAGHAVIGLKLENASIVQKVTIVPRGQAGGYNLMMPREETYFRTQKQLKETITGYLGGRVAEEIIFKDVSTGASNDFENATKLARAMVTEYGMSPLGPIQYEQPNGSVFLGRDYLKDKNFSDQVAMEIDKEVRNIIEDCYAECQKVIGENLDLLTNIANYLLKLETLNKADIDEIASTGHLSWYDNKVSAAEVNNEEEAKTEVKEDAKEPTDKEVKIEEAKEDNNLVSSTEVKVDEVKEYNPLEDNKESSLDDTKEDKTK